MLDRRTFAQSAAATVLSLTSGGAALAAPAALSSFERDRKSILAMAGNYKVRFDMRETVSFRADYTPIKPSISGGEEVVKVIEDTGRFIALQHMLVADVGDDQAVIKHWRQDWAYEPASVLEYVALNRWATKPVPAAQRAGAWSQTVWQTDDSPRYGGVGKWAYDGGVSAWTSDATYRPLARRDATRHPVYDRYLGYNRHALTPTGWVHEQENAKQGVKDGERVTYVHEVVLNTYNRFDGFKHQAAEEYWTLTGAYWAGVRAGWNEAIRKGGGVRVEEEAENGSVTGRLLMGWADEIIEGKLKQADASAKARALISETAAKRA